MTQDEIDTMWQKAMKESIKEGEMFTRYRFAKLVAERALADPMREVQRLGQEIEQEPVAKPYAYEYGRCNADGTYSVVIEKGDLVQTSPAVYNYVRPRNAHKDWPIKELFDRPQRTEQKIEQELSNGLAMALHDAVLIRIGKDDEATRQAIARIDKLVAKYEIEAAHGIKETT